jgi:hypothetical protein
LFSQIGWFDENGIDLYRKHRHFIEEIKEQNKFILFYLDSVEKNISLVLNSPLKKKNDIVLYLKYERVSTHMRTKRERTKK